MPCSKCGGELKHGAKYCSSCGKKVKQHKPTKLFCHECGEELPPRSKFCVECGTDLIGDHPKRRTKKESTCLDVKTPGDHPKRRTKKESTCLDVKTPDELDLVTSQLEQLGGFGEEKSKEIRILLVGHTGHGKSETGNSLLGRKEFKPGRGHCSVTKTSNLKVANRFGWQIEIVDTPGFFDSGHDDRFVFEELSKCIALTIPGFNAILFTMRPERFSAEIVKTVDLFFEFFGENVEEFAYVVLTHTRNNKKRDDYIGGDKRHPKLNELLLKCKQKVLIIDNKCGSVENQVKVIYERIIEESKMQNRPFFANERTDNLINFANAYIKSGKKKTGKGWIPKWIRRKTADEDANEKSEKDLVSKSKVSIESQQVVNQNIYNTTNNYSEFKNAVENDRTLLGDVVDFVASGAGAALSAAAKAVTGVLGALKFW